MARAVHDVRYAARMLATLLGAAALAAPPARPNIVFIMSDDHCTQAISCYGASAAPGLIATPGIDRIAREGMRFDRSSVTNAICGPSRAVMLTGKHSHINGFATNDQRFDGAQPTFPKLLREAGYRAVKGFEAQVLKSTRHPDFYMVYLPDTADFSEFPPVDSSSIFAVSESKKIKTSKKSKSKKSKK